MNSKLTYLLLAALLCNLGICVNGQSKNATATTMPPGATTAAAIKTTATTATSTTHLQQAEELQVAKPPTSHQSPPMNIPEDPIIVQISHLLDEMCKALCDFNKSLLQQVPMPMKVTVGLILESTKMAIMNMTNKIKMIINTTSSNGVHLNSESVDVIIDLVKGVKKVIKAGLQIVVDMMKPVVKSAPSLASTLMKTVCEIVDDIVDVLKEPHTSTASGNSNAVGVKLGSQHKKFTIKHHKRPAVI